MKLDKLRLLYHSMRQVQMSRVALKVPIMGADFDVLFFAEGRPFRLIIGIRNKVNIQVDVLEGYQVNPTLTNTAYKELITVLGASWESSGKFNPSAFFQELNDKLPSEATHKLIAKPQVVAAYCSNIEDPLKRYFIGVSQNDDKARVSVANLHKTRVLLGEEVEHLCAKLNMSTRWSENYDQAALIMPILGNMRKMVAGKPEHGGSVSPLAKVPHFGLETSPEVVAKLDNFTESTPKPMLKPGDPQLISEVSNQGHGLFNTGPNPPTVFKPITDDALAQAVAKWQALADSLGEPVERLMLKGLRIYQFVHDASNNDQHIVIQDKMHQQIRELIVL